MTKLGPQPRRNISSKPQLKFSWKGRLCGTFALSATYVIHPPTKATESRERTAEEIAPAERHDPLHNSSTALARSPTATHPNVSSRAQSPADGALVTHTPSESHRATNQAAVWSRSRTARTQTQTRSTARARTRRHLPLSRSTGYSSRSHKTPSPFPASDPTRPTFPAGVRSYHRCA